MEATYEERSSWLEKPIFQSVVLNWELVLFSLLLIAAVFTRFYDLESRVMSHDENSHVYYSWIFSQGRGYTHDPITHGPFQFHAIALSYFLFGASDFTARIPVVLFSIAAVAFLWSYRRYLGRIGALVAALLMVISPYILYYGRYVRNEAYVALYGLIMLWAILRYIESGKARYLFYLTAVSSLHFATKETAFIYTAQALIFLGFLLVLHVLRHPWQNDNSRKVFQFAFLGGMVLIAVAGLAYGIIHYTQNGEATEGTAEAAGAAAAWMDRLPLILVGLGLLILIVAFFFLLHGYTWRMLRAERSFALIVVLFTMVMPMLAPFPVDALGVDPIDYNSSQTILYNVIFVSILALAAVGIGLLWNPKLWLLNAALFYAIFTVLYTSVFTNGAGFFTGLVGSLGYWLDQQAVNRGSQPLYYYWLIQVPMYEFLPAIGSILAILMAALGSLYRRVERAVPAQAGDLPGDASRQESLSELEAAEMAELEGTSAWETGSARSFSADPLLEEPEVSPPAVPLLIYWAVSSLLAYTIAGEKMPWLTVHITLPMILLSGWSIGRLIERMDWSLLRERRGWLTVLLLPVFLLSLSAAMGSLLGANPPFQGQSLEQLKSTGTFMTTLITAVISGGALFYLFIPWPVGQILRLSTLFGLGILALLTARAAFRAAYINYDNPKEYLVYAHSATGVKQALAQIEEISRRTTDGLALKVAYDNETSYPYWWYLRDYPNAFGYGANPSRSLRDYPVILVGDDNFGKLEPVVGQAYFRYDYIRLWWPNQDYFYLTSDRLQHAIQDPQMRAAIFDVWLNRDYKQYQALVGGSTFELPTWSPADRMRLYIRKDIVSQLWNYGAAPVEDELFADPYEDKGITLVPDKVLGSPGSEPGQFLNPRDLAVAPDGSLYVVDTDNNRIQHISTTGEVLHVWGRFADRTAGDAPGGTFNQPWGIGIGPDGSVYVADLWNYRIQKFTPEGQFLLTWGYNGLAEAPEAFWGPRDVAVDSEGRVFVTDTGNDRVVVFDENGQYITQFGKAGLGLGELDEPVSVAVDDEGRVYVSDVWNQRIQVFEQNSAGGYQPVDSWDVAAWYGQSASNKPYLAVSPDGYVYASDPEGYRILQWTLDGEFVLYWGDYSTGADGFGLAGAVAVDGSGGVWVSDSINNRILHFNVPSP